MFTKANQKTETQATDKTLRIEDISVLGEELSEEQLQLVSGSRAPYSYTEWVGGPSDRDKPF